MILKESKLIFVKKETTWTKTVQTLEGNVLLHEENIIVEDITFDQIKEWEEQIKKIPVFNIVETVIQGFD